jgi:hypothetical protein
MHKVILKNVVAPAFWASSPKGAKPSHLIIYGHSFRPSVHLSICSSVRPPVRPSVCLYVRTFAHLNPLITLPTEMGHREPMTINAVASSC